MSCIVYYALYTREAAMLDARKTVPLPDKGVQVYAKNGRRYAYKVTRTYRNAKGQPTCDRRSIGRVDDETGMLIPNLAYYEFYGDSGVAAAAPQPQVGAVYEAGVAFAARAALSSCGALAMLESAFGESRASEMLTVAAYMLAEGNVMSYLDDFCERSLVAARIDDRRASELFASLLPEERAAFFSSWASAQAGNDYVAYDVTSFSSYSEGIADLEWGYNRDGEKLPQINLAMYLGVNSRLPVFYRTYPGSIVDKKHLPAMMAGNAELGVAGVTFVMDCGFVSTGNLQYMHGEGFPYLIGLETFRKAARNAIAELRGELSSARTWIGEAGCHGAARKGMFYGVYSQINVFHDADRAARAEADMHRRLDADEERLSQMPDITKAEAKRYSKRGFVVSRADDGSFTFERDWAAIDAAAENLGYFCILTSELDAEPAEVLAAYRKKDEVEKAFDEVKNHLDMHRLRTHRQETTDGKVFCAFVALIARMRIENALGDWMRENRMAMERVMREFAKVRCVQGAGGKRLLNPLTKKQREIVGLMGFAEDDVRAFVERGGHLPV